MNIKDMFSIHGRYVLNYLLVILIYLAASTSGSIMGDECDFTGSGLSTSSIILGVTPVYLRCSTGKIKWMYPRGALRVLLRLPGQNKNFRACIKMKHENLQKDLAARVYLEGPRSLIPLYTNSNRDAGSRKAIRCFNSKNRQAALYIEALDYSFEKRVTEIEYDLQPFAKNVHHYDPTEECKPCSTEELAHAFCTSDLVTRGILRDVENEPELELSKMHVKITKLIRHNTGDEFIKETETNEIPYGAIDDRRSKYVTLNMPQHCGVSHGTGEFVFMARRKLGDLTVRCAPRLEEWALLVDRLTSQGKANCILRS